MLRFNSWYTLLSHKFFVYIILITSLYVLYLFNYFLIFLFLFHAQVYLFFWLKWVSKPEKINYTRIDRGKATPETSKRSKLKHLGRGDSNTWTPISKSRVILARQSATLIKNYFNQIYNKITFFKMMVDI